MFSEKKNQYNMGLIIHLSQRSEHGLTLIPALISNWIHYNVWDVITYPFLNFNGATVEV